MIPTRDDLEPVIAGLSGVRQNPDYHGEGDALAHTRLVMEALEGLPAFSALNDKGRAMMRVSAALHDLGKKVCTRLEEGRWVSPHHSAAGAAMVRELLMTRFGLGGTPEAMRLRESVCMLIRWHMRPTHVLELPDPGRCVRQMAAMGELATGFTLARLAMLAEADQRGRLCADQQEKLDGIALFAELAREEGCLEHPFAYPDPCSRYADLSGRNVMPGQQVYDSAWGTVVMLSGLPGTGKDTFRAAHFADLPMLSLDDLRRAMGLAPTDDQGALIQRAREDARVLLRRREPFVFNATNLSPMIRGKWIQLFHQYGARVRIVYLETGWTERERRNASRHDAVPEEAVSRMLRNFTPPALTEAEEVEWISV